MVWVDFEGNVSEVQGVIRETAKYFFIKNSGGQITRRYKEPGCYFSSKGEAVLYCMDRYVKRIEETQLLLKHLRRCCMNLAR